jgi:hypothetical protein
VYHAIVSHACVCECKLAIVNLSCLILNTFISYLHGGGGGVARKAEDHALRKRKFWFEIQKTGNLMVIFVMQPRTERKNRTESFKEGCG